MWFLRNLAFLLAFGLAAGSVARADGSLAFLPQAAGERVQYHVVRSVTTSDTPATAAFDFTLQRKSPTTLTLEHRDAAGTSDISVLDVQRDGSLQVDASERAVASEADVRDLVAFLDLAVAALRASNSVTGWEATLEVPAARGTTEVDVPIRASHASGVEFDIEGEGESDVAATSGPARGARVGGGFPGSPPGGGFPPGSYPGNAYPGGGSPRARGGAQPGSNAGSAGRPSSGGMTLDVAVNGHVSAGRVMKLSVVATRALTVDGLPFTNVSDWSISVVR
jgi:hypothetical protein